MSTVVVTGGRDYGDKASVYKALDVINPSRVVHGGARGADALAAAWAAERGIECVCEPAEWGRLGVLAGQWRNIRMLEKHRPDLVLAFPGGAGTAHCERHARLRNIKVIYGSDY